MVGTHGAERLAPGLREFRQDLINTGAVSNASAGGFDHVLLVGVGEFLLPVVEPVEGLDDLGREGLAAKESLQAEETGLGFVNGRAIEDGIEIGDGGRRFGRHLVVIDHG